MNDIFEIAKTYGEADYYDMCTGRTYLIAEWARAKSFGLPTIGIRVMEPDGSISSYIPDPDNNAYIKDMNEEALSRIEKEFKIKSTNDMTLEERKEYLLSILRGIGVTNVED